MENLLKLAIGIILLAFIADMFNVSLAEVCTVNGNCTTTSCSNGYSVICQHPDNQGVQPDGGLCTCASTIQCSIREDCYASGINLNCPNSERHCYDTNCICDRFPING